MIVDHRVLAIQSPAAAAGRSLELAPRVRRGLGAWVYDGSRRPALERAEGPGLIRIAAPVSITAPFRSSGWRAIGPGLAGPAAVAVDLSTVDTLQAALTCHRERHTVLAGNVANLDTPGYRPSDLERRPTGDPAALAVTCAGHIAARATADLVTSPDDDGGAPQGSHGNAVSLMRELDAARGHGAELVSRRLAVPRYATGTPPEIDHGHFTTTKVSASGLSAERTWMNIAASNLAYAQTTQATGGAPYRCRAASRTCEVGVTTMTTTVHMAEHTLEIDR